MNMMHVNGVKYHVQIDGQGTALVLLHGFTGSSVDWEPFVADWATHYQVIRIDILGYGRSAKPTDARRYSMTNVAADLVAIITELDLKHVHLLGYSMGGRLALYTAVHYPHLIKSLILESASPGLATADESRQRRKQDTILADFIEAEGMAAFVAKWEKLSLWQSQSQLSRPAREHLREQRLQNDPIGLANSLRGMGTGQQPSLWPFLVELDLPVLLLTGQMDQKFIGINQEMAAQLPNATYREVVEAGHTIHLEQPNVFDKCVREWLF